MVSLVLFALSLCLLSPSAVSAAVSPAQSGEWVPLTSFNEAVNWFDTPTLQMMGNADGSSERGYVTGMSVNGNHGYYCIFATNDGWDQWTVTNDTFINDVSPGSMYVIDHTNSDHMHTKQSTGVAGDGSAVKALIGTSAEGSMPFYYTESDFTAFQPSVIAVYPDYLNFTDGYLWPQAFVAPIGSSNTLIAAYGWMWNTRADRDAFVLWISKDQGRTLTAMANLPPLAVGYGRSFNSVFLTDSMWYIGGIYESAYFAGTVYWKTEDGGQSFEQIYINNTRAAIDFDCADEAHCVNVFDDNAGITYVYATQDGGQSWECALQLSSLVSVAQVQMMSVKEWWLAGGVGEADGASSLLMHTLDGGSTWTTMASQANLTVAEFDFVSPNQAYVFMSNAAEDSYGLYTYQASAQETNRQKKRKEEGEGETKIKRKVKRRAQRKVPSIRARQGMD